MINWIISSGVPAVIGFFILLPNLLLAPNIQAIAQSQGSRLTMRSQPAFEGNFKYGQWLPIWVELENHGNNLEARVQARISNRSGVTVFSTPALLPSGARKQIHLYILPNNYSREVEIQVIADDDQTLASQKIAIKPQPPLNFFVGLATSHRGSLSNLTGAELPGQERTKTLIDLDLSEWPERFEGLRSFDLLVINNLDTSLLTPEKRQALKTWVYQGGRLVIGGGPNAQNVIAGLPESLLPMHPTGSVQVDHLPGLEIFTDHNHPILIPGPFVLTTGKQNSGLVLASQNDIPLILETRVGSGYVNFIALDVNAPPFDAWSGSSAFWEKLIAPGAAYPDWLPSDISTRQNLAGQLSYALSLSPLIDLSSISGLVLVIGLFIALVGPVNYLALRWRNRLNWAWVTIPLITITFSLIAFGIGRSLHGREQSISKIVLVKLLPDNSAYVDSFFGLYSPNQGTYQIEVEGNSLLSPLEAYQDPWSPKPVIGHNKEIKVNQGNPGFIDGRTVELLSMERFMAEGLVMDFGHISSNLIINDENLEGVIHNQSPHQIKNAVILQNDRYQIIGDIPPGGTTQVNLALVDLAIPNSAPPVSYQLFDEHSGVDSREPGQDDEVKRIIIETILDRGWTARSMSSSQLHPPGNSSKEVTFIGWLEDAPRLISINGRKATEQTTALVIQMLTYHFPAEGWINVPVGLIPGWLSESPKESWLCGEPGSLSVYIAQNEVTFDFHLPQELINVQVENLKLSLWADLVGLDALDVSLFNWEAGQWVQLTNPTQGINLVADSENYIRGNGLIQVKLTHTQNSGSCVNIGMGLEGWR